MYLCFVTDVQVEPKNITEKKKPKTFFFLIEVLKLHSHYPSKEIMSEGLVRTLPSSHREASLKLTAEERIRAPTQRKQAGARSRSEPGP